MSRSAEGLPRIPFSGDANQNGGQKHIPILPSSAAPTAQVPGEAMDLTTPTAPDTDMGPPPHSSPDMDHEVGDHPPAMNGGSTGTVSAAAAASSQQPKVVQTAFIHKLYNMLEDQSIRTLISWSSSNESFVMSPCTDFSKVLAQYFKHTNISSFVRQLNMYGFHKVSDVFHTGAPESTLWEFKHGNGNFRRGDLVGLREIKRRASRHALIHRDSFSSPHKPSVSQPGTPAEPIPDVGGDARLAHLEHNFWDMHARLMRTEESNTALSTKCAVLTDTLSRSYQWNHDLSSIIMSSIPDHESQVYRDLSAIQGDISRHLEMIRGLDDPHETLLSRQPYFSNMALEATPVSPRQPPPAAQEERRGSAYGVSRPNFYRPPVPAHLTISPHRYGSIGTANPSPNYQRPTNHAHPPPAPPHPLSSVQEPPGPNLGRRHTSADIRLPGWPGHIESPFPSGESSGQWPSPPDRTPNQGDQHVQSILSSYEFGAPRKPLDSRQTSPPSAHDNTSSTPTSDSPWAFGGSGGKFPPKHLDSAPQTRRSSMASNVHSLLNPAETTERPEEDTGPDDRKRKRMQ